VAIERRIFMIHSSNGTSRVAILYAKLIGLFNISKQIDGLLFRKGFQPFEGWTPFFAEVL
jgi:hypothetical protein